MKKQEMKKNKPVATFKDYPVQVAVWKKTIDGKKKEDTFTVYDCSVTSSYKDKDGNYQSGSNFKEQDLLKTGVLLQSAYQFIQACKNEDYAESSSDEDEDDEDEE